MTLRKANLVIDGKIVPGYILSTGVNAPPAVTWTEPQFIDFLKQGVAFAGIDFVV